MCWPPRVHFSWHQGHRNPPIATLLGSAPDPEDTHFTTLLKRLESSTRLRTFTREITLTSRRPYRDTHPHALSYQDLPLSVIVRLLELLPDLRILRVIDAVLRAEPSIHPPKRICDLELLELKLGAYDGSENIPIFISLFGTVQCLKLDFPRYPKLAIPQVMMALTLPSWLPSSDLRIGRLILRIAFTIRSSIDALLERSLATVNLSYLRRIECYPMTPAIYRVISTVPNLEEISISGLSPTMSSMPWDLRQNSLRSVAVVLSLQTYFDAHQLEEYVSFPASWVNFVQQLMLFANTSIDEVVFTFDIHDHRAWEEFVFWDIPQGNELCEHFKTELDTIPQWDHVGKVTEMFRSLNSFVLELNFGSCFDGPLNYYKEVSGRCAEIMREMAMQRFPRRCTEILVVREVYPLSGLDAC